MSRRHLEAPFTWGSFPKGTVSLTELQMVHLKTTNSLGQRTKDPHVIQVPVEKSLLPLGPPLLWDFMGFCFDIAAALLALAASSSVNPRSGGGPLADACLFFFLVKSNGNGWLMERPCCGRRGFGFKLEGFGGGGGG